VKVTLDRVFSKAGIASRTETRAWIAAGRVRVRGRTVRDPDLWVDPERDRIALDGKPLRDAAPLYLLLYKPKGVLTTRRDADQRKTVYDLLPEQTRYVFPVGRLDRDTSGLLLLTNDSAFAQHVASPEAGVPKTYQVKAATHLTDAQLAALAEGVVLADGPTRPARVRRLREAGGKTVFEIVLREGRNRQVRRMVEAIDSKVLKLVRTAIGPLRIGTLTPGAHRALSERERRYFDSKTTTPSQLAGGAAAKRSARPR
jgi:pseudouridine synthase